MLSFEQLKQKQINEKCDLISRELTNADKLFCQGQTKQAKQLYTACAEAIKKMVSETQDDPNFTKALQDKHKDITVRINRCDGI